MLFQGAYAPELEVADITLAHVVLSCVEAAVGGRDVTGKGLVYSCDKKMVYEHARRAVDVCCFTASRQNDAAGVQPLTGRPARRERLAPIVDLVSQECSIGERSSARHKAVSDGISCCK